MQKRFTYSIGKGTVQSQTPEIDADNLIALAERPGEPQSRAVATAIECVRLLLDKYAPRSFSDGACYLRLVRDRLNVKLYEAKTQEAEAAEAEEEKRKSKAVTDIGVAVMDESFESAAKLIVGECGEVAQELIEELVKQLQELYERKAMDAYNAGRYAEMHAHYDMMDHIV